MSTQTNIRELAIDRGEPAARPRRGRRAWLTRYVLPGALLAGFLGVLGYALRDALLPSQPVTVVPVTTVKGEIHQAGARLFNAAGYVEQRPATLRVPALADGVVEKLLVVENDPVEVGQEVAYLVADDARLAVAAAKADYALRQAEHAQAEAALHAAQRAFDHPVHLQAALAEAVAQRTKTETELKTLPFELDTVRAREQLASLDYETKTKARGVLAGVEIEKAKAALKAARAEVASLARREELLDKEVAAMLDREEALRQQLELKIAETKALEESKALVDAAQARVDQAQVVLDQAELRLKRTVVRSPFKGRVLNLVAPPGTHVVGDMARGGEHDAAVVITVYQPENLQVRVDVRYQDLPQVVAGQPVLLENDALPKPLRGRVLFSTGKVNVQKNTAEVKVIPDEVSDVLRPEMLLNVTFLAPEREASSRPAAAPMRILAPAELLETTEQGAYLWVADQAAGQARRVKVQTGATRGGLVEVVSGLQISSRLIVGGRKGLRADGQRIRVTGEDKQLGLGDDLSAAAARHDGHAHPGAAP